MICLGLSLSFLTNCASVPQKTLDAVIILNSTAEPVFDVQLRSKQTSGLVNCSAILPNRDCSVGFSTIENKGHDATLSWMQGGRVYKQKLPKDQNPAVHPQFPNKAVITILNDGQLTLSLD
jgi:hypothetical protein